MPKSHKVVIIPGLGDRGKMTFWITRHWQRHGLKPFIFLMDWYKPQDLQAKLTGLTRLIDDCAKDGDKISLVGCSAGASAALNAFCERKNIVHKVVSVCGRLRAGNQNGFRSFESRSRSSAAFTESVKLFESRESAISKQDKKRIMAISALFGDELVPADTSFIHGANNITIPTIEHSLSILMALTIFSKTIIEFLAAGI